VVFFALGWFTTVSQASCEGSCDCKFPSGYSYDLTKFSNTNGKMGPDENSFTYDWSLCPNYVSSSCVGLKTYVCQHAYGDQFPCADRITTWLERSEAGSGFFISFYSYYNNRERITDIEFICDKHAGNGGMLVGNPAESPMFHYHFSYVSRDACGKKSSKSSDDGGLLISGGWLFLILLFCVALIYVVVGVGWNLYKKKRGKDLLPHWPFWSSLPSLVFAGCCYFARGVSFAFAYLVSLTQRD